MGNQIIKWNTPSGSSTSSWAKSKTEKRSSEIRTAKSWHVPAVQRLSQIAWRQDNCLSKLTSYHFAAAFVFLEYRDHVSMIEMRAEVDRVRLDLRDMLSSMSKHSQLLRRQEQFCMIQTLSQKARTRIDGKKVYSKSVMNSIAIAVRNCR